MMATSIFRQFTPLISRNFSQISQRQLSTSIKLLRSDDVPDVQKQIDGMVKEGDVVVFMKGVPAAPRCGFSNAVCQILRMHDVNFEAHDVLADESIRQGT